MNGNLSSMLNSFHSLPRRLLISALCISGCSEQIFLRCIWLQTMNEFIGLLTWLEARLPEPLAGVELDVVTVEVDEDRSLEVLQLDRELELESSVELDPIALAATLAPPHPDSTELLEEAMERRELLGLDLSEAEEMVAPLTEENIELDVFEHSDRRELDVV